MYQPQSPGVLSEPPDAQGNGVAQPPSGPSRPGGSGRLLPFALLLLLALVLGILGSLNVFGHGTTGSMPHVTPVPTRQATQPAVRMTPQATQPPAGPTPQPTAAPGGPTLPSAWTGFGRGPADFDLAGENAATFIDRYKTIAYTAPGTFEWSVFLLTDGAQARFFGRVNGVNPNVREQNTYRQQVVGDHLIQVALADASTAQLVQARVAEGRLFAWVAVSYEMSVQKTNQARTMQRQQMTVLLMSVPYGNRGLGTGWQVSDWRNGVTAFAIPTES